MGNFVLRTNQEESASYRKPFTEENFENLFLNFHIANNLLFNFVENNKTSQDLLYFCVFANQNSDLKIVKLTYRQTLTTFTIDEYNRIKKEVKSKLLQQDSLNFITDIWTSELGNLSFYCLLKKRNNTHTKLLTRDKLHGNYVPFY